jgi:hypothetical protein
MAHASRDVAACALALCSLIAGCDDEARPTGSTPTAPAAPAPAPAPVAPPPVAPANAPPVPSFKVTPFPPEGKAPLVVNFNLCPTADPEGDPILFVFDFGDGSDVLQGPPCRQPHTYTLAGHYRARMCLWDFRPEHSLDCLEYFVKVQ